MCSNQWLSAWLFGVSETRPFQWKSHRWQLSAEAREIFWLTKKYIAISISWRKPMACSGGVSKYLRLCSQSAYLHSRRRCERKSKRIGYVSGGSAEMRRREEKLAASGVKLSAWPYGEAGVISIGVAETHSAGCNVGGYVFSIWLWLLAVSALADEKSHY